MRYVKQDKPVTTNHDKLGELKFEVEVPQAESLDEAKTMCGGEQGLLDRFNSQVATDAKNLARAYARNYEVADNTDVSTFDSIKATIATKGQEIAKDYSPSTDSERGPSKAKKAAAFDQISQLVSSGQEFTMEQLQSLLAQAK